MLQVTLRKRGLRRELRRTLSRTIQGVVFFWAIPHFHENKFTTPLPPLLRGILRETPLLRGIIYAIHCITRLSKMKIPIQLNPRTDIT